MDSVTQHQLAAIDGAVEDASRHGRPLWLRGGWAIDFSLGRITRAHEDVDWFALADDAEGLVRRLECAGWTETPRAPLDQQRDLVRDDVEFGIALLRIEDGRPYVAGGPFGGEPWPPTMITRAMRRTLKGVTADVIGLEAQIEIKQMMPTWVPQLVRRQKDQEDIRALQTLASSR